MNVRRPVSLRSRLVLATSALVVAVPSVSRADAIKPVMTPTVQSLGSADLDRPSGVGSNGLLYGQKTGSGGQLHAATTAYGIATTDLGTLGGNYSSASGMNASGVVVGESSLADNTTNHGFVAQPGGSLHDIGTLGGSSSTATAINNAGQVVGGAAIPTGETRAFVRSTDGTMTNLGTLGGGYSIANGINAFGTVVGQASTASGNMHAFAHSGGSMTDLGTLGGSFSAASAINGSGMIVGQAYTSGDTSARAFLYDGTKMTDLGVTNGFTASAADSINSAGEVVGKLYGKLSPGSGAYVQHAFLYRDGIMTDLNTLLPASAAFSSYVLNEATGIDDQGRIVGIGTFAGKSISFALMIQAVPEPSTLALFGVLGVLAVSRWVRR